MIGLPDLALSVRQPWAWAIIYAGKDIENRTRFSVMHLKPALGRRAIHASQGMTKREYDFAREFMERLNVKCPAPHELIRGAIIGSVDVTHILKDVTGRRWGIPGNKGLVLNAPVACDPIPCSGALGYFKWQPNRTEKILEPAKWMRPPARQEGLLTFL